MKEDILRSIKKWFLPALFACYVSGVSFFTHTHTINHIVYIHSHPYKKGEQKKHTHTNNELYILDLFYHTTITDDVVAKIDVTPRLTPFTAIYLHFREANILTEKKGNPLLRAPPAA